MRSGAPKAGLFVAGAGTGNVAGLACQASVHINCHPRPGRRLDNVQNLSHMVGSNVVDPELLTYAKKLHYEG
ncbi:hypothetical protein AA11237_0952 [Acidocella aminolytica 101 = DSM 11237]|nr:hypothetical protein AA11237_0952 [Acidocella aminolytica 101 = DSM 11237]